MLGIDRSLMVKSTSRWIIIGIAAGVLALVVSVMLYWQIGKVIDGMIAGDNLLLALAPLLIGLLVAKFALGWLYRSAQYRASALTKLTLRDKVYRQSLRMGPAVLDKKRTGELVNIAVDGMDWIELFYGVYFVQFVVGMATPVLLCLFIGVIDWVVGLALIVSIPLTPVFLGLMASRFRKTSQRYAEVNNEQSAQFLDSMQGMATLKMFNLGKVRGEQIHAATEAQRKETMRLLLVNQIMILFVDFGFALGTTLVLTITALLRFDAGALSPGEVVALILVSAEFARPLTLIGQFFFAGAVGREFSNKIIAFLAEQPNVRDPAGVVVPPRLANPALHFQDVSFSYPGAGSPAVNGFSLDVRPGETVALVGQSGSGKTTITNLVLRALQPASGTISLDGQAVEQVPSDWVREHIALVPQDPYLFHGTLAENLRVARADATDAELEQACAAANILDHVRSLPQGFATLVGERGLSLSGGQVQRIAIARALLKNAPIVILDEPTSQIDLETEKVIHDALETLTRDKTVLLVAHRLSTVEKADRIVVMGQGRVLESGSHQELTAQGGVYARMVATGGPAPTAMAGGAA